MAMRASLLKAPGAPLRVPAPAGLLRLMRIESGLVSLTSPTAVVYNKYTLSILNVLN